VRPEGVPDLGPVEGDADRARVDGTVVGDVGERKPFYATPPFGFEDLRDHGPIVADAYPPMASSSVVGFVTQRVIPPGPLHHMVSDVINR
jgi:hypothetical protein